ncbi:MAG: hypothetical protein A2X36_00960 [Elusimicrobia bacterium GWA2_69_24]|nr:MAG: hypothetical protein A2X36_00960 [Elusimicrobia bacterium GWA2_69_24]HBL17227.1 dehydrogenase [Elusimicrobiota bacterium]
MRFHAAVLREPGKPLTLEELQVPKLRPGQVLVKLGRSGICAAQLAEAGGGAGSPGELPRLLGHEGTGWVHDLGAGIKHVNSGDHVVLHWRPGRGAAAEPARYRARGLGTVYAGPVSTFGEYAVVSADRVTAIPPDFDPDFGALMGCAVTTGLGIVNNNAKVRFGESVVVRDASGIGLSVVQGAALASAGCIVAVDAFEPTLALARKLGATHAVNERKEKLPQAVLAIVGPGGADVVVGDAGGADAAARCCELARPGGRVVLVGVSPRDSRPFPPRGPRKTLSVSQGGESRPDQDIPRYVALHRMGKLPLSGLVTARYRLEKINEALSDLRDGKIAGRCLLLFQ